jgi:hypothetical protein
MTHKDELAWRGSPAERRSGGFVDGVAMNGPTHALAFDPDGVVGPEETRPAGRSGPGLDLERMGSESEGPVQRNGRVRLTRQ